MRIDVSFSKDGQELGSYELVVPLDGASPPAYPEPESIYARVVNEAGVNIRQATSLAGSPVAYAAKGVKLMVTPTTYVDDDIVWRQIVRADALPAANGRFVAERALPSSRFSNRRWVNIERDFNVLDVEWLSQIGPDATAPNDCGQACIAMYLNYKTGTDLSPDDVSRYNSGRTTANELASLARQFGSDITIDEFDDVSTFIVASISSDRPVILLVEYEALPFIPHLSSPAGLHWFMVVGYSLDRAEYFVHDPLWPRTMSSNGNNGTGQVAGGAYLRVYDADLRRALRANYGLR